MNQPSPALQAFVEELLSDIKSGFLPPEMQSALVGLASMKEDIKRPERLWKITAKYTKDGLYKFPVVQYLRSRDLPATPELYRVDPEKGVLVSWECEEVAP